MMKKPPLSKGLNIKVPIIIPIKGRGFINKGSGLPYAPYLGYPGAFHLKGFRGSGVYGL